jgi:predicted nucleotidyltransferase
MVDRNDDQAEKESRPPELKDLLELARALNERGAKYVIVGGMAIIQQGFTRATEDIDLLIENSRDNIEKVIDAVAQLPDHAAREISVDDFDQYEVIRVADEIVVDLMASASGVSFAQASAGIVTVEIQGIKVPFADADLLVRKKQGVREKDVLDRHFLEQLLRNKDSHKK